jgi:hypothetical protein
MYQRGLPSEHDLLNLAGNVRCRCEEAVAFTPRKGTARAAVKIRVLRLLSYCRSDGLGTRFLYHHAVGHQP